MTDTPPSSPPRLSTPTPLALPGLRQLTEVSETESEREPAHWPVSRIIIDAASPTTSEEPDEIKNKDESKSISPSHARITSSDKLSALPSHLHSSPAGRAVSASTRPNRSNSGSPEGASLDPLPSSTTITAHVAQTPTLPRRAPPVSHSLSDSAADYYTLPRQRISFDSERDPSTSPRPADRPLPASSEPVLPSTHGTTLSSFVARAHESVHGRLRRESHHKHRPGHSRTASHGRRNSAESHTRTRSHTGSPQRSPSPSRGVLPLRSFLSRFSPLSRAQSREEPFIPVDPFRLHAPISLNPFACCFGARRRPGDEEAASSGQGAGGSSFMDLAPCGTCACVSFFGSSRFHNAHMLAFDTLPRQLYLHSQLRLPSLYFSRVARIFEDAAVSRPEIRRILDTVEAVETEYVQGRTRAVGLPFPEEWVPPNVSPALARFKRSWENFVDSLVREWKTLNVLSALLLSAILTLFQIQDAEDDPLTRTAALCSLISALMSLSYGIMYIIRFGNMRSMYRASRWAEEAQKTETAIFWNVWVLLALPGVWLTWSVLAFIIAIMSYVWRTGARGDSHPPLSRVAAYGPRIAVTCQLFLGLVYFALVIQTFRSYGESGRKARVVRRLTDAQVELETRREWERERGVLANAASISRMPVRESEPEELATTDDARDRGRRSRGSGGSGRRRGEKTDNELGLSGMDRKRESLMSGNGDIQPVSDSYSSLGI